ncbi:MAG: C-type lectin domain-containing protein [Sandaracinaceae bacterium]|nr:C-type lectin domain-containing protein [Sandaracinaceae bacterium]
MQRRHSDWDHAQAYCAARGGALTSIETGEEHFHITGQTINVSTWIGGRLSGGETGSGRIRHRSTTQVPLSARPTHAGPSVSQMHLAIVPYIWPLNDNRWDDTPCGSTRSFICERPDSSGAPCGDSIVLPPRLATMDRHSRERMFRLVSDRAGVLLPPHGGSCSPVCTGAGLAFSRYPMSSAQQTFETTHGATHRRRSTYDARVRGTHSMRNGYVSHLAQTGVSQA